MAAAAATSTTATAAKRQKKEGPPPRKHRVLLEVCVDSIDGCECAMANGADRIELCSALGVGGLTPSYGLMEMAAASSRQFDVPVVVMIRPRPGTFVYSKQELEVMKRDIAVVKRLGLAGVVFGVADAGGGGLLDRWKMAELVKEAKTDAPASFSVTLHRAIDLDSHGRIHTAVEIVLIALPSGSLDRILTSGGAADAWTGREMIRQTVEQTASYGVSIMAGAGLTPDNVAALVKATGVTEVHASCSVVVEAEEWEEVVRKAAAFGFSGPMRVTDGALVKAMADIVHSL